MAVRPKRKLFAAPDSLFYSESESSIGHQ